MKHILSVVAALALFSLPALAEDIVVAKAVVAAPPSPKASTAAAYFTIENKGAAADTLLSLATPTAEESMLHQNKETDGVMTMIMLDKLEIPAGGSVAMKPGDIHVMLLKPVKPYEAGGEVPFELTFAHAGKIAVTANVVPLADLQGN